VTSIYFLHLTYTCVAGRGVPLVEGSFLFAPIRVAHLCFICHMLNLFELCVVLSSAG